MQAIVDAFDRYTEASAKIPAEWLHEYNYLCERLEERRGRK